MIIIGTSVLILRGKLMYLSRVKAKGKFYFYLYIYDGSTENQKRIVHRLGKTENARSTLDAWQNPQNIPLELVSMGLDTRRLPRWKESLEGT